VSIIDGVLGALDSARVSRSGVLGGVELVLRDLDFVARGVDSMDGRQVEVPLRLLDVLGAGVGIVDGGEVPVGELCVRLGVRLGSSRVERTRGSVRTLVVLLVLSRDGMEVMLSCSEPFVRSAVVRVGGNVGLRALDGVERLVVTFLVAA